MATHLAEKMQVRLPYRYQLPCREESRIAVCIFASLNIFLLRFGLDCRSQLASLHRVVQPFIELVWASSRDARLREVLVTNLRIQLRLGVIQVSAACSYSF